MKKIDWESTKCITDFAYFPDFYASLMDLEKLASPENWKYSNMTGRRNTNNPILENYVHHTFKRLRDEYLVADEGEKQKIIYIDSNIACFNLGLYTKNYNVIYALFRPARKETDKKPWSFWSFEQQASHRLDNIAELPRRANYFSDISELIYDHTLALRANVEHILQENIGRFPIDLQTNPMLPTLFTGAVELAKKKVASNYRIAVPTYYNGAICLMLPLCLTNPDKTDLALAIQRNGSFYTAKTVLTLDMAYNDARLIAKPDNDWLIP